MSRPIPPSQPVARRGRILTGGLVVEYDLLQPAPTQWVALGLVRRPSATGETGPPMVIVGTGVSPLLATEELARRVSQVCEASHGYERAANPMPCRGEDVVLSGLAP